MNKRVNGPAAFAGSSVRLPPSRTEDRNPLSVSIDRMPTMELLRLINAEDRSVPAAVAVVLPALAAAVDLAVQALSGGHRVHYVGAGTSGRIAVLDAAELIPTFGIEAGRVVAHLAGGTHALTNPSEDAEDDEDAGTALAGQVAAGDLVVGLTASGRTPYVRAALTMARRAGAGTVLISANPASPLAPLADVHVAPDTGPEVITGSTRMKAGTAQKLVLNAFSTATMVRLGRTYSNLMTDMQASNDKLRSRQLRILAEATGADVTTSRAALAEAGGDAKLAVVMLLAGTSAARARQALTEAHGHAHRALSRLEVLVVDEEVAGGGE
ncbi:N-acetylmuramic acid 6-phosphate etherase [Actinoplanes sp. TBRC 11911]|uniref:N-acetylmuramic acid 6-phosphate etherase n=1 Tax=Actinoplanes sp. TBRC 11911 TaxID=2729386 RepID=UPI00145DDE41|nr:N-acetylmuramic acid 6-phosphate etherase [Actinoplanes sp. TBRC 11911]NMO53281.1 N-acetylmuramic acid 6-phosphate etherase [Actinoplanes sp. TBRC 11911]